MGLNDQLAPPPGFGTPVSIASAPAKSAAAAPAALAPPPGFGTPVDINAQSQDQGQDQQSTDTTYKPFDTENVGSSLGRIVTNNTAEKATYDKVAKEYEGLSDILHGDFHQGMSKIVSGGDEPVTNIGKYIWDAAKKHTVHAVSGELTETAVGAATRTEAMLRGFNDIKEGKYAEGLKEVVSAAASNAGIGKSIVPGSEVEKAFRHYLPNFSGMAMPEEDHTRTSALPTVNISQYIDKNAHPVYKAIAENAEGFSSPENIALMAATDGLGMIASAKQAGMMSRMLSAGWTASAIQGAYQHMGAFKQAWDEGNEPEALYQFTHGVLSGALATRAGQHAGNLSTEPSLLNGKPVFDKIRNVAMEHGILKPNESADAAVQALKPGPKSVDRFKKDWDTAVGDIKAYSDEKGQKISTVGDLHEAVPEMKDAIWTKEVEPATNKHLSEKVDMSPVKTAVLDGITDEVREFEPVETAAAEKFAEKVGKSRTVGDATDLLTYIDAKLNSYFAKNPGARRVDLSTNPETAMWENARRTIRDQLLTHLEDAGEDGIRDARIRYGALSGLEDTITSAAGRLERNPYATASLSHLGVAGLLGSSVGLPLMMAHSLYTGGVAPALAIGAELLRRYNKNPNVLTEHAIKLGEGKEAPTPGAAPAPVNFGPGGPLGADMSPDLHAGLSTYLDKTVGDHTPEELETMFQQKLAANRKGGRVLDKTGSVHNSEELELYKMLNTEKANAAAARQKENQKKLDDAAKEEKKAAAAVEKIGEEGETKAEENVPAAKELVKGAKTPGEKAAADKAAADKAAFDEANEGSNVKTTPESFKKTGEVKTPKGENLKTEEGVEGDNLDEDELQTAQSRTPETQFQQRYNMTVDHADGTRTEEPIDAHSFKQALKLGQKKFPDAKSIELGAADVTQIPRQQGYVVPTGKHLNTPGMTRGMPIEKTMRHELGHYMVGHNEGFEADAIERHTHPDMPKSANAAIQWNLPDTTRNIIHKTPERVPALIRMIMGGVAADEVFSGVGRDEHGVQLDPSRPSSDGSLALRIMKEAGFSDDVAKKMMNEAINQAKEHLTKQHVSDIINENADVREPGLSKQYHFSGERLKSMGEEAQRRANEGNKTEAPINRGAGEAGDRGNQEFNARAEAGNPPAPTETTPKEVAQAAEQRGLNRRSVGNPEHDRIIESAGAIPAGVAFPGDPESEIKLFHDPKTGSTLGFKPGEEVTPEAVQRKMDASRKQFGVAETVAPEEHEHLLDRWLTEKSGYHPDLQAVIKETRSLSQTPEGIKNGGGFITPDGQFSMMRPGQQHPQVIERANAERQGGPVDNRPDFLNDTGAIRTRYTEGRGGPTLAVSMPEDGITPAQIKAVRMAAGQIGRNANLILETAGKEGVAPRSEQKEFAKVSDVQPMLEKLGMIKGRDFAQKAVDYVKGGGFTIHPNGQVPTEGHQIEVMPERRKILSGPITEDAVRQYHNENKDLFDEHPELHIGGYNGSQGGELNISAHGDPERAAAVGNKLDQEAAWDNEKKELVPLQGKNQQTQFPNYPLEQRLEELNPGRNDFNFGHNVAEPAAPTNETPDQQKGLISTALPKGKKAIANPLTSDVHIGIKSVTPEAMEKIADKVKEMPGFRIAKNLKDPVKVVNSYIRQFADNLKDVYNRVPEQTRQATAKWYESANGIADRMATQFGKTLKQGAGVLAALSPQKDWDQNVSLAKRVYDIYHTKGDMTMTPEMEAKVGDLVGEEQIDEETGKKNRKNDKLGKLAEQIKGKTFNELQTPLEKAAFVRLYDEAHNTGEGRNFRSIDPGTGEEGDFVRTDKGNPRKVAWGSLNEIAKAVSILDNGSRENISDNLGEAHKVRNFYNNILDPNNPAGHVTVDTHAVAAGHQRMLSGNSPEVGANFGQLSAAETGLKGMYAVNAEAYRQAAKELGLQPRQLQSIVWEEIRKQFPDEMKRVEKHQDAINDIWQSYKDGKITQKAAQDAVRDYATKAYADMVANKPANKGKEEPGKISAQRFLSLMSGLDKLAGQ